jgi:RND superfamily putative drug exporter
MRNELFYRFGTLVYNLRWLIICLWVTLAIICIPIVPHVVTVFKSTGFIADHSRSAQADEFINQQFGFGNNKFIITYSSHELSASNPLFMKKIRQSLSGLKSLHTLHYIVYPDHNKKQISKDNHTAYAVIFLKNRGSISAASLTKFKSLIKTPAEMTMNIGGEPIFVDNINKQTQLDLFRADYIAAPVTVIMMLIIFESIVAAIVPVLIGAGCAIMILTILYLVGSHSILSIFTLNIALLLGLCLSLDYALFIISRFRYEIRKGHTTSEAVALTQATAGKAVFFSGLAVLVSLSALLFFPINILFSVGVGGIAAVFVAVTTANIILPAILGILGTRINFMAIKLLTPTQNGNSPFWRGLVTKVVRHPLMFFISILVVLLTLSYPVMHIKFGISDYRILPPHSESRIFFDEFHDKFNENTLTPIQLIIQTRTNILSSENIARLFKLTKELQSNPLIAEVNDLTSIDPSFSKQQYQALYSMPLHLMKPGIKTLLDTTTRDHLSVITIVSKYPVNARETKKIVKSLQEIKPGKGVTATLAGTTLSNIDVFSAIKKIYPYAISFIMLCTYLILLLLLRSVLLPVKAIVMTILSLAASYGMLVFIIQDGHFSQILHFQPQGMLDISLLIIIFCALFGFSMDYEVFLLTRINENHEETHDTNKSIIFGVEHSSRIITSAALIVIVICCSFMVADVLMVKAFGLGIAVAIFTDAFLIRSLLVPATMAMMGRWNWYLPRWLGKILPKL